MSEKVRAALKVGPSTTELRELDLPDVPPDAAAVVSDGRDRECRRLRRGHAGRAARVVGHSAAKKQNPLATVVLLSEEHCEPYEKPPLSKAVLLGKALPSDALIAGPSGTRR